MLTNRLNKIKLRSVEINRLDRLKCFLQIPICFSFERVRQLKIKLITFTIQIRLDKF